MEKLDGLSMDVERAERDKLQTLFPQCFSEGKLDLSKLLALLGQYDDNDFEKYRFEWKGKAESLRLAQTRSMGTLRPAPTESIDWDTTQNLYIEGDNLEVLKLLQTAYYRRQKIGRGLRLCVDQEGNRIEDRNINVLHVIANESFADFAQSLQKEIEDETGMRFGMVDLSLFVGQTYEEDGEQKTLSHDDAAAIMAHLGERKLITKEGKMTDAMKLQLAAGTLDLGARFSGAAQKAIIRILEKTETMPPIRDASKEVTVRLKKQVLVSPEFAALWDKIKQKTTYRVQIDTETLATNCIKDLQAMPPIPKARLITQTAEIDIARTGVGHTETQSRMTDLRDSYDTLPDILRVITTETLMKRSTVAHIIEQSGRGRDFLNNPQAFTEKALEIIARNRHRLAVAGVSYLKLAGEEYYVQEIFDDQELIANLNRNAVSVQNSVYDYVIYDSTIEQKFAAVLDSDNDVKMFFKIPRSFKIDTPIGTYNPDWAVLFEQNGEKKLYFVLETKGTTDLFDLRGPERLKIHCGQQHFNALDNGVQFKVAKEWGEVKLNG